MNDKISKKIFFSGCGLLSFGILFFIIILGSYSKSGPETDSILIFRNQIIFYSIFVGLGILIFGYMKMPKKIKSGKEKKRMKIIFWLAFFIFFVPVLTYGFISSYNQCLETKGDYEQDIQIAIEKYDYKTFDEWREANEFSSNCVKIIWRSAAPPIG